ncbi:MAG: chloride channel protein [Lactobacillaceae bacterium]|jgi:H+/Cl- antiporter ClcA|nr:chloride channel protein [Lactobacillaceae bacterium]
MFQIDRTRIISVGRAVVVGLLVGFVVSGFRFGVERSLVMWKRLYSLAHQNVIYLIVIASLLVLITIVIGMIIKPDPNVNGSGIPQVEGQLAGRLDVNAFSVLWRKFTAGILAIGSGAMLGREGPSIQLGAAVGQLYAQKRRFTEEQRRLMIATGSAAGLSAAFAAPVAGAMFVLEEIYRSFSMLVWLGTLTGAVVADIVSTKIFGLKPVLHIQMHSLPLGMYWMLPVLGIILGILGYAYQKVTLNASNFYKPFSFIPRQFHFGIVAIGIILIGYFIPDMLGGGNNLILNLGHKQITPTLFVLLGIFLIRFSFSAISFGSGVPGGIFLPILSLGAVIGGLVSVTASTLNIWNSIYFNDLAVLGMVGYFAAISKAPFTAIILIAEMVGSLEHLVPLAIVVLISYLTNDVLGGQPIYESLLEKIVQPLKIEDSSGKLTEARVRVMPDGGMDQKEIREVSWPKATVVSRVERGSQEIIARGDVVMQPGDELVLFVDTANYANVLAKIKQISKGDN